MADSIDSIVLGTGRYIPERNKAEFYSVVKNQAEKEQITLDELLRNVKEKYPVLNKYGSDVISSLNASYDLLNTNEDEVLEKLAETTWPFKHALRGVDVFSTSGIYADPITDKDKKYDARLESILNTVLYNRTQSKKDTIALIKEILCNDELTIENSMYAESLIDKLRYARGDLEQFVKASRLCGHYLYGKIVSDLDEGVLIHELGHYILAEKLKERHEKSRHYGKILRVAGDKLDEIGNFFYKKEIKPAYRFFIKMSSKLRTKETNLFGGVYREVDEGFSEAICDSLTGKVATVDDQKSLSAAWKKHYGQFSHDDYVQHYQSYLQYFLEHGITEKTLDHLFDRVIFKSIPK